MSAPTTRERRDGHNTGAHNTGGHSTGGRLPPPPTPQQRALRWIAGGSVLLALVAASSIGLDLPTLIAGGEDVASLVERMLPPRVDDPARIAALTLDTVLMAFLGTVLATFLSVPLAFLAARTTTPHPAVATVARGLITFCRAVPDLVFAVLFVRALGLGVLPGVLALALHSVGMLGKLFADAIEDADPGPREAVRSVGVGPLRELLNGVVPQVVPAWVSAFVYRVDINLRTSVVLGFVGAGGIGFALQDALRGLVYPKALGIVAIILVVVAAMELLSMAVRRALLAPRNPRFERDRVVRFLSGGAALALTVFAFVRLGIDPLALVTSVPDLLAVAGRTFPPDLTSLGPVLWEALLQTLAIGLVATAIGVVLSLPLGLLAARNVAPHPVVHAAARTTVLVVRAVPELVLAVILVAAVGLGPVAGAIALGIGSIGFLGKLVADAVEEIPAGPAEAVRSVGGGWWKVLFAAVLPQSLPSVVGSTLYLLDVNIRTSTILGIVGAGGVGFLLFEAVRTLRFEVVGGIVLLVFVVVLLIERLSGWIRAQLT
ncbi:phosphonate transport system permease protein [Promicromonospora umidemergens]|uniref:Phosphonate ABC transporter, permease protein PhnE n=1 Tax=Promicromonospora umidemergens TaxID=629679 RepID=A0ABP8XN56_9MICO|nr:phosphonate ABC transporter, permease protein PhnE [Promicromonospora umidemergens]MCP2282185.1 phosphonate transport system permease protein [Promicromonospora umidemergens]